MIKLNIMYTYLLRIFEFKLFDLDWGAIFKVRLIYAYLVPPKRRIFQIQIHSCLMKEGL